MRLRTFNLIWLLVIGGVTSTLAGAAESASSKPVEDWPQFRGPAGDGHSDATGLPFEWSETKNIVWKKAITGLGWSSPVIHEDQLWLTTATDEGRQLLAICLDPQSGKTLHEVTVFEQETPAAIHSKNSHASPTPILEEDRAYIHFGAHGTACLDRDGKIIWKTNALKYDHRHGPAGSPVVYRDLLILSCDGTDVQFVVALDKGTGEIRWKADRQGRMAYSTPLLIHAGGQDQLISPGGDRIVAYRPSDGTEIWSCKYDGYSVVPRPVYGHGLIFFSTGYDTPSLYALRTDGNGDITDTHLAWSTRRGAPNNPSPLLVGDELYVVSDRGVASCLDARTGQPYWQERLGGEFSASPLLAEGRIYFLDEDAKTTVIAAAKEYQLLAINPLEGRSLATPAIFGRSIYLRTDHHLYRIEAAAE